MKAITLTAAAFAADIDIEHALETLRPGHRCLTFGGCLRSLDTLILFPFASRGGRHQRAAHEAASSFASNLHK